MIHDGWVHVHTAKYSAKLEVRNGVVVKTVPTLEGFKGQPVANVRKDLGRCDWIETGMGDIKANSGEGA